MAVSTETFMMNNKRHSAKLPHLLVTRQREDSGSMLVFCSDMLQFVGETLLRYWWFAFYLLRYILFTHLFNMTWSVHTMHMMSNSCCKPHTSTTVSYIEWVEIHFSDTVHFLVTPSNHKASIVSSLWLFTIVLIHKSYGDSALTP